MVLVKLIQMESNFPSRVRCSRKLTAPRVQGYAAGEKLLRTISCQLLTEIGAFMLFPFLKLIFFLNSAFTSVFISEFAHFVFHVVAFPHIVTVTSVAICPIRQTLVIRYFRFGIHQVVG